MNPRLREEDERNAILVPVPIRHVGNLKRAREGAYRYLPRYQCGNRSIDLLTAVAARVFLPNGVR